MSLRGAKVLARCDEAGNLVAEGGRVEIRYKPNDGRAYFAAASNLQPIEGDSTIELDTFCAPAEAAKKKPSAGGKPSTAPPPEQPEEGEVLAYADGACSGNPGPAGLGVVALWDDQRKELSEFIGEATNNVAELTAILRAIELAQELGRPLRLYTDSKYAIGVLTQGWKARANQALIGRVRGKLMQHPEVEFFHVRGHQGIPLNEVADKLAVQAVENRDSTGWVTP